MESTPIKYSDLVSPDNSITNLIQQLNELANVYNQTARSIKEEAIQVTASLRGVSGATEEGREKTKKAASDADRLAKAQRELAFAESENAKKLQELKMATSEANKMNKLVIQLNQSAKGSFNHLSAQYALNKIAINHMTQAERDEAEAKEGLITKTKQLYEEMKRMQKETGQNQLNVGNYTEASDAIIAYGEKLKASLGINNKFGESLLALGRGGEESKAAFAAIGQGVKSLGKSLLGLMANPIFLSIAGIAGAGVAVKWWYDYNNGIKEATKLTMEFTGLTGDALKSLRNEITAIADTFGKDFKETLQATDALAANFGISFGEAAKAIKDGFVAGADVNGDFLSKVKQYPAYFKEAGLSAKEFIAIVSQTRSGIFGDAGLDAIKQANARLREMKKATAEALDGIGISSKQAIADLNNGTKTTFDILQEVSAKLAEFPESSQKVGEVLINVFGKQGRDAGLAMIKSLKDISTNLDDVKSKTGELGKLQEEQANAQVELENALSALFDQTGGGFERMTTGARIFVTKGLTSVIKGVIKLINYFVELYNKSVAVRVLWNSIVATMQNNFALLGNYLEALKNYFQGLGGMLKGILTLSWEDFATGFKQATTAAAKMIVKQIKEGVENFKEAYSDLDKQIAPLTIPVIPELDEKALAKELNGKDYKDGRSGSVSGGKVGKDDAMKAEEAAWKKRIELNRKYEDLQLEIEQDAWRRRKEEAKLRYNRQIEDLRHQLDMDLKYSTLTESQRRMLNEDIRVLEYKKMKELISIRKEQVLTEYKTEKEGIDLRMKATAEGTEEYYKLMLKRIEIDKKISIEQNKLKDKSEQQSESDITAQFNKDIAAAADAYIQGQMALFDKQQDFQQSEFDLLKNSEERKTRFRLEQERKRLEKILELNKIAGTKLSELEIQTIKNTIAKIDQEIQESSDAEKSGSIYGLFGLNLTKENQQAIDTSVSYAIDALHTYMEAYAAAAAKKVELADAEVSAAQKALDAEIQARANGYANNVKQARKELDLQKRNQEKALQEQREAQRMQQAVQAVEQMSNLVTASSLIWSQLGFPWAIPALATMWGSFAYAKIKAAQMTSEKYGEGTVELLSGGSHQSGNDIDLGSKPDGTRRRAEGGEFFAVINKRNSRKYRRVIPDLINSLNEGNFEHRFTVSDGGKGLTLKLSENRTDLTELQDDVSAIRKQGETKYSGGVLRYKNLTRRIV